MATCLSLRRRLACYALVASLEVVMKLLGSIEREFSRSKSSASRFLFSPAAFFPLAIEDPAAASAVECREE